MTADPISLRGIDAATLSEWRDLAARGYVSRDAEYVLVADLPKVLAENAQAERKPLTMAQIALIADCGDAINPRGVLFKLVRAVERAHGIKEPK